MSRSAFHALQNGEDLPLYDANTSDEDEDMTNEDQNPIQTPPESLERTPSITTGGALSFSGSLPQQESKYISSNFTISDHNTVYGENNVIFGLKVSQTLIVRGQFVLEIQRGAININGITYHSSSPALVFMNPVSHALPIIQAAQVTDRSKVRDTQIPENDHLFSSEYKSVVKLISLDSGLETIGRICPLFKNLFWNFDNLTSDDLKTLDEYELAFHGYSFFPILKPDNTVTTINYKNWMGEITRLTNTYKEESEALKVLVIGGKNSGKSTFLRLLLQSFLCDSNGIPINFLDLDPGQPEYSKPDSISLSKISENQFGNHLSLTNPAYEINHYIGFNSPKDQPKRYENLVNDLILEYGNNGAIKNESLLINTPGWIKGYGLKLTKNLIERVRPTHIVYLNSGSFDLEDLVIPAGIEVIPLLGMFNNSSLSRYSSSQLRILKILSYFHKRERYRFDFQPLLFKSPVQVSYGEHGIRALHILSLSGISEKDSLSAIEGSIVALYSFRATRFQELKLPNDAELPFIKDSTFLMNTSVDLAFKSLALIHSIDREAKLINLYIPPYENIKKPDNHEYILIRGKTEVPIWEFASNEVLKNFGKTGLPYVSFEKSFDLEKVSRVRKTVQRRGQL